MRNDARSGFSRHLGLLRSRAIRESKGQGAAGFPLTLAPAYNRLPKREGYEPDTDTYPSLLPRGQNEIQGDQHLGNMPRG